jgi:hypothetical protein
MGLTATKHKALDDAELVALYNDNQQLWRELAEKAYLYMRDPLTDAGEEVRPDDVNQALVAALELSGELREHLQRKKLRQKYWNTWFAELIIDQLWSHLEGLP